MKRLGYWLLQSLSILDLEFIGEFNCSIIWDKIFMSDSKTVTLSWCPIVTFWLNRHKPWYKMWLCRYATGMKPRLRLRGSVVAGGWAGRGWHWTLSHCCTLHQHHAHHLHHHDQLLGSPHDQLSFCQMFYARSKINWFCIQFLQAWLFIFSPIWHFKNFIVKAIWLNSNQNVFG